MASISKTVRPKRSSNASVSPTGFGLTAGRGTPVVSGGGGGSGTVLVSTDWSTGTGSSDTLLREDAKPHPWGWVGYGTKRLDVISASGLGFPSGMTNVLRALSPAGSQTYTQVQAEWTPLSVGETLFIRLYFRQAFSDAVGSLSFAGNHTVESAIGGGSFGSDGGWTLTWGNNTDGTFPIRWDFRPYTNTHVVALGTNASSAPVPLTKGVTYRLEWSLTVQSSTTMEFHARVFDEAVSAVTPLYDDTNISGYDYDGGFHSGTLASGYGTALPVPVASSGTLEVGPNGSGWSLSANQYAYYGGVRVVKGGTWIGAYVPGES